MKLRLELTLAVLAVAAMLPTGAFAQLVITGPGGLYPTPFAPAGSVLVDPPDGGLLTVAFGGSAGPAAIGNWDLSATGGASVTTLALELLEYGSETSLTGTSLVFGSSTVHPTLLSLIGSGTSITSSWDATLTFDQPGSLFSLSPNTTYSVSFFADGQNGLLSNTLNISPSFTFEFLDGAGNPVQEQGGSSVLNLFGLFGNGVTSGTANFTFTTGSSVAAGAAAIRFSGDADLNTTALNLGTQFAEVSNLSITASPVPEPHGALLLGSAGIYFFGWRRRLSHKRSC